MKKGTKKIEDFMEKVQELSARRAALNDDIQNYRNRSQVLTEEAKAAAVLGDLSEYAVKTGEANNIQMLIQGKQIQLDSLESKNLTDEAREAWSEYEADYAAALQSAGAVFKEAKENLIRAYRSMLDIQDRALATREQLAAALGVDASVLSDDIDHVFPMQYINENKGINDVITSIGGATVKDPDAVYYLASLGKTSVNLWENEECKRLQRVLCIHRHHA